MSQDLLQKIALSGIACRLPESSDLNEFWENLISKHDMVTEDGRRWKPGLYGLPGRNGKLKDISRFDAAFFGVHPKQANSMDPQLRILMELTYEAILDAGVDPEALKGSKTGVFIGVSGSEAGEAFSSDPETLEGYSMTGCCKAMFANRLSFFFDFKGPSYAIDTACSSSMLAMHQAVQSIRRGDCDMAIVGGSNLLLKPNTSVQFMKLGMLSSDGMCKAFDADGKGYVRSESCAVIFLIKPEIAKRVYANILHSGTNTDGFKDQGVTFPSGATQLELLRQVYSEVGLSPNNVKYVEAHGTGTKAGDPQEINAITEMFCNDRPKDQPLLIGSVKSNMGHSEPASGVAAIAKVVLSMEKGIIPPNLHYDTPNPDIPALSDGRLKVVDEATKFPDSCLVGVNSFGFGGSNVHVVLEPPHFSHPLPTSTNPSKAQLVTFAARTEEALHSFLDQVHSERNNQALIALINELSPLSASGFPYRGYTLINSVNQEMGVEEIKKVNSTSGSYQRPIWFICSGMGSQWNGMGKSLLQLDIFKESILKSTEALKDTGINVYDMLTNSNENTYKDTLHSFVGLASIQVALIDLLKALNVNPDGIVGHSVGELACAYADGCLNAEEVVKAAYWRGKCVQEANLPPGAMAAVGLTWEEAMDRCPEGVVPACHNAEDTVTISGPKDKVAEFVEELKAEEIFAKEVYTSGVAFHSPYMAQVKSALKEALDKVIKDPRPRTARWISSSIPEEDWDKPLAQLSSADYHVNNLLSPVLFQEGLKHIPEDAITIEISPHCLLQAILKRSLNHNCSFVGLMKRSHPSNLEFFLSAIGKCYMESINPTTNNLYPPVEFPVPRGTPSIASLIQWDHAQEWDVPTLDQFSAGAGTSNTVVSYKIDTSSDSENNYLLDHCIDGRSLFPATGYLVLVWRTLARLQAVLLDHLPVRFENVAIHRATVLSKSGGIVELLVNLSPTSGNFEVSEGGELCVSGKVEAWNSPPEMAIDCNQRGIPEGQEESLIELNATDIYKELRLRGYDYGPYFQGISTASHQGTEGKLLWNGNWVSFLDAMLQIQILNYQEGRNLRLPTRIGSVIIDPTKMLVPDQSDEVTVVYNEELSACTSGGVEIRNLHTTAAPRRQQQQALPTLEQFCFTPYTEIGVFSHDVQLQKYQAVCQQASFRAMKNLSEKYQSASTAMPNEIIIQNFLNNFSDDGSNLDCTEFVDKPECGLLTLLKEVPNLEAGVEFSNQIKALLESGIKSLDSDMLLKGLLNDRYLKNGLDIVMENSVVTNFKVVELNAEKDALFQWVIPAMKSHPLVEVNYTAIGKSDEKLSTRQQLLDKYGVNTLKICDGSLGDIKAIDLVVASDLSLENNIPAVLANIHTALNDGGFLLLHETTTNFATKSCLDLLMHDELPVNGPQERDVASYLTEARWSALLAACNFEVVSLKSDGLLSTLFLCRRLSGAPIPLPTILNISEGDSYEWVEELKNLMASENEAVMAGERLWLVVDSAPTSGLCGLVNCLRRESGGSRVRCIFNSSLEVGNNSEFPTISKDSAVFSELARKDLVMNVFRKRTWGSFRYSLMKTGQSVEAVDAYVNVLSRGDLSSLRWIQSPSLVQNHKHHQLFTVYYASLNFRDIMLATGKLPPDALPGEVAHQDCVLGMEFAGRDSNGRRVMGLLPAKGLATSVEADPGFTWEIPDSWTMQEAASVPVVYATAYYALVVRGRLRKGESVLIHSGSGGVGQAAISLALHRGCRVFTTVGSKEKREYLKEKFPQLTDDCFANSRDTTFEKHILLMTKGKGVNVILNSLAEEKLEASLRLLARHGRFLEIGKYDLSNNTPLGMALFLRNVTFHGILLDALFESGNSEWEEVKDLVTEGIRSGEVRPLKTTVFERDDIEPAFRYMAQGKHIGKVLIEIHEEERVAAEAAGSRALSALPRATCHPEKSYIITGGLGGFGLELADWLIKRGARSLVLTSRSGVRSGYQSSLLSKWRRKGVSVSVSNRDVSDQSEALQLIKESLPIGGLFHLAVVLRDGLLDNQTTESYQAVCNVKCQGTANLDKSTRELCGIELDWFVAFSSVVSGRGNLGQTNYGFANSTMERICEKRFLDGIPGLSVQWGAIGDVGVVISNLGGDNETVVGGTYPQRISSCLEVLDTFLNQPCPVLSSFVLAEKSNVAGESETKLIDAVTHVLGVKDYSSLSAEASLAELGLDSLMGVEIHQILERDYGLRMSIKEVRQLTINKLLQMSNENETSTTQKKENPEDEDSPLLHLNATEALVKLNRDNNTKKPPLFFVHPIEGHVDALEELASKINCPCYGLQCTEATPLDSIYSMAQYYITQIRSIQPSGPYRLAGYSFGACVAFEMSIQLEQTDQTVERLALLDGSHAFVSAHTQAYRAKSSNDAEAEAMCAFVKRFINDVDNAKLKEEMLTIDSFNGRAQLAARRVVQKYGSLSEEEVQSTAAIYYRLLVAGDAYTTSSTFSGDIMLFRAKIGSEIGDELGRDLGLRKVCNGTVSLHEIEGNHQTILKDKNSAMMADILNQVV